MIEPVKKYISEAFFILLERKDLSKLTINELIKKAGVCKASFYRNFDSYESIIKGYLTTFFNEFPLKYSNDKFTMKEDIKEMLLVFFANRKKLNILNKRNLLSEIYPLLFDKVKEFFFANNLITNQNSLIFISGGITSLIYNWIKGSFKGNTDELTSLLLVTYEKIKNIDI